MKILLDENLPHELRHLITGHQVFTVAYMGWKGVKNGVLLAQAAAAGFAAMITMDTGVPYQQNVGILPLSVVVLRAISTDIDDLRPLVPQLNGVLNKLVPKTIAWIG